MHHVTEHEHAADAAILGKWTVIHNGYSPSVPWSRAQSADVAGEKAVLMNATFEGLKSPTEGAVLRIEVGCSGISALVRLAMPMQRARASIDCSQARILSATTDGRDDRNLRSS
jgi:hypothetical protein